MNGVEFRQQFNGAISLTAPYYDARKCVTSPKICYTHTDIHSDKATHRARLPSIKIKANPKMMMTQKIQNQDDLKNEDKPKSEDDPKNEDKPKNEDDLGNEKVPRPGRQYPHQYFSPRPLKNEDHFLLTHF